MIPFPLSLRPAASAGRAVAAWYLPGTSAAQWIAELAAWGLPMSSHRLYLTPEAPGSRAVGGLLVLPGEGRTARATARAQGYTLFANKLLLPADAELEPPVNPAELERKLPGPLYWLHPTIGLVMFREDEAHRVRDLLEFEPGEPRAWNRAQSGISRSPRLHSVEPDHEPSVQAVLDDAREDIASESAGDLPPVEEEQAGEGVTGTARRKALEAIDWLTGQAPQGAAEPTWVDRVQDWARKKLAALDPGLRKERHRELFRLLKMLKDDPDKGLKYAIPLRGSGSRGLAEPGARLGSHNTDFDLGRLGGGGPSDSWDAPFEVQQRLRDEYRNAALRALHLGRHRRAAYIYAELLGDFDSAASALRQGRHFREAAILFREKLKKPLEAARCLEEGGLLTEAIAVYDSMGQHMKVGELYEQLEQPEEAVASYRRAAQAMAGSGDLVRAAQVLEARVRAPEEALELLASAWPGASQAALALRELYALLARLARHEQALKRTEQLRAEPVPEGKLVVLVTTLSHVARTYPDQRVRGASADLTRVLAGRGLESGAEADIGALANAVVELVPADRLLDRDADRYLTRRRRRPAAPTPARSGSRVPVEVRREQLLYPGQYQWKTAVACGEHFYALGLHRSLKPTLLRSTWDGRSQSVQWSESIAGMPRALLEPPQGTAASALVWLPGGPVLGPRLLAANDRLPLAVEVGTPSWLPEETIGLTRDDTDTAWVLRREGNTELMLAAYSAQGSLLGTVALESGPQTARVNLLGRQQGHRPAPAVPVPMAARQGHVLVGLGNQLLHVFQRGRCLPTNLMMDARAIVLCAPYSPGGLAVAVTFASGASIFWPTGDGDRFAPQHVADGKANPLACFTRAGQLVLLTREEGLVLEGPPGRMSVVATFPGPRHPGDTPDPGEIPVALLPGDRKEEFAVLTADGGLRILKIPTS